MSKNTLSRNLVSFLLAVFTVALALPARADVSEKAGEAKDATVHAAQKTGQAVSEAASAAVEGSKRIAHKTADVAVKVYDKTKEVTKSAIGTAAEKTKEVASKVEDSVKK